MAALTRGSPRTPSTKPCQVRTDLGPGRGLHGGNALFQPVVQLPLVELVPVDDHVIASVDEAIAAALRREPLRATHDEVEGLLAGSIARTENQPYREREAGRVTGKKAGLGVELDASYGRTHPRIMPWGGRRRIVAVLPDTAASVGHRRAGLDGSYDLILGCAH